ncbi:NAD-dependent protein lipoamidase sirtuin-4, mitochondrial-like [Patiria miniata]|uniref:NAD-dependent protein deacylase n=1 Tax=Patiria miniata TaxID=46514 RepID=A0A913ZZ22_PATMI|nr:NAD-dependent protein lipoamidase sirtuin-4, mitochondrial-like [Patiria miniata]
MSPSLVSRSLCLRNSSLFKSLCSNSLPEVPCKHRLYSSIRSGTQVEHLSTQPQILQPDAKNGLAEDLTFVPNSSAVSKTALEKLQDFVSASKKLFVLTGAGMSTESGIPDYRSEGVGLYARSNNRPITYQDFLRSPSRRRRYWARNFVGWPRFSSVLPNASHWTFAEWERAGKVHWLVTQNVDALHTKAQSRRVIELHGCSARIVCLSCAQKTTRDELQQRMRDVNPQFNSESQAIAPDGDVILSDEAVAGFTVPSCSQCRGMLKPDLVFFGDNVPGDIRTSAYDRLQESDAVLVAGSSLEVYSGYRFALAAKDQNKPLAIVNIGPTRADKLAVLKIDARISSVLPGIQVT